MSDFTLTDVSPDFKVWEGQHGTFHIWEVTFEGGDGVGVAEIKRKSSSPAPKVDEVIDAEIVHKGDRKPELKRIWKQDGASPSTPGRGNWSPEKERSIVRQHSQDMAIQWVNGLHARGLVPPDADKDFLVKYIDWFQADAEGKLT